MEINIIINIYTKYCKIGGSIILVRRKGMKKILAVLMSLCILSTFVFLNTIDASAESTYVTYQTHVEDYGWQDWVSEGQVSGAEGESKRLEAIKLRISNANGVNIKYRTHIQDYGWQNWVSEGQVSGTEGESKRLEAIQIDLDNNGNYDLQYRVHVEEYGWQDWKSSGEIAGTEGESKRVEAIQVKLIKKAGVSYQTHIQDYGWQDYKSNGQISGTEGESKRLEGIKINLDNTPSGMGIRYRTHIQDYGWQSWKSNGKMSGTEGESKRLEAIQIELLGAPVGYRIEYRVHVQDYGWSSWVGNGKVAGTQGEGKRLEAIEIRLIRDNNNVVVIDPGHGGSDSGAVGAGFTEKFLNLEIAKATVKYLKENGVEVYMTRETDKTVSLKERTDFANSINPNLFISIHNDSGSSTATGAHVIYSNRDINGGASKLLANNILNKITTMTTQNANGRRIWTKTTSEDRDWYHIIRESTNPAVIVECAFLNEIDIKSLERSSVESDDITSEQEVIDENIVYDTENSVEENNGVETRAVDTPEKRDAMGKAIAYGIIKTLQRQ